MAHVDSLVAPAVGMTVSADEDAEADVLAAARRTRATFGANQKTIADVWFDKRQAGQQRRESYGIRPHLIAPWRRE
jgi:hypothetical protein